jgi:hypothetical protein
MGGLYGRRRRKAKVCDGTISPGFGTVNLVG